MPLSNENTGDAPATRKEDGNNYCFIPDAMAHSVPKPGTTPSTAVLPIPMRPTAIMMRTGYSLN